MSKESILLFKDRKENVAAYAWQCKFFLAGSYEFFFMIIWAVNIFTLLDNPFFEEKME